MRCVFRRDSGSLTFDVPSSETSAWRAVARVLRSPVDALSCVLLPSSCTLCGSLLPHLSSAPICAACWSEISPQTGPSCAQCGDTLDQPILPPAGQSNLCRVCRLAPPPFVSAVAFGVYDGRLRQVIHAFKYQKLRPASGGLGSLLAYAIGELAAEAPRELLVIPVPLHRSKHTSRGFNQARALAAAALTVLRKTHPDWRLHLAPNALVRVRATESQAGLTPRQRRQNLRGAFQVADPTTVAGKHILVVDDILTTGATARAAARVLMQAGAESVRIATLARARRRLPVSGPLTHSNERSSESQPPSGTAPDVNSQPASMYAQNQPSF